MESSVKRVAVIGSGYSGLCTLKHLSADPSFQLVAFEQADCIGGIWKYPAGCEEHVSQPETSPFFCRIYRDMRTNGPRDLLELEDFPFPKGGDSYCNWAVVNRYLRDYAEHFKLTPFIKFRHRVTQIIPVLTSANKGTDTSEQWDISYENLDSGEASKETFDAVAICNGHYNKPHRPDIRGLSSFTGHVIHSNDFRDRAIYKNKTVLIIGASISAADLAVELVPVAKKIIIAKPPSAKNQIFPSKVDNVQEIPMIQTVTTDGCVLADGTTEQVDSIILCTGYEFDYPFLHEACQLKVKRALVTPLYHHMFNCHHPTMAFIYIGSFIVATPVLDHQVKYFKAVLKGEIVLPSLSEMLEEADNELNRRLKEGLREHEGHVMDHRLWGYIDGLARELGIPSYEPVLRKIYEKVRETYQTTPLTAKKYVIRKVDSENYFMQPPADH